MLLLYDACEDAFDVDGDFDGGGDGEPGPSGTNP